MAQQLTVSVITTRKAYEELEREGLITTRAGTGSFVTDRSDANLLATRMAHAGVVLGDAVRQALDARMTREQITDMVGRLLDNNLPDDRSDE